jgi:hypothetical protein
MSLSPLSDKTNDILETALGLELIDLNKIKPIAPAVTGSLKKNDILETALEIELMDLNKIKPIAGLESGLRSGLESSFLGFSLPSLPSVSLPSLSLPAVSLPAVSLPKETIGYMLLFLIICGFIIAPFILYYYAGGLDAFYMYLIAIFNVIFVITLCSYLYDLFKDYLYDFLFNNMLRISIVFGIIIIGLVWGLFGFIPLMLNVFALFIIISITQGVYYVNKNLTWKISGITVIILAILSCIATALGLLFPPEKFYLVKKDNENEHDKHERERHINEIKTGSMITIYLINVLLFLSILYYLYTMDRNILSGFVGKLKNYFVNFNLSSFLLIIGYMIFISYFHKTGEKINIVEQTDEANKKKDKNSFQIINLVAPISILIGVYLFYRCYSEKTQINDSDKYFKLIKQTILFALFIGYMIEWWTLNPGDFIHKYFSQLLLIIICASVFGLIYAVFSTYASLENKVDTIATTIASATLTPTMIADAELLRTRATYATYGLIISFAIFLIVSIFGFLNNENVPKPGEKYSLGEKDIQNTIGSARKSGALGIVIVLSIIWIGLICMASYYSLDPKKYLWEESSRKFVGVFKIISGLLISGFIIWYLVYSVNGLSKETSAISTIINLCIIIFILGLLYKILKIGENEKANEAYQLAIDIVLYIPCLFTTLYDNTVDFYTNNISTTTDKTGKPIPPSYMKQLYDYLFGPSKSTTAINKLGKQTAASIPYESTKMYYVQILVAVIVIYVIYFYFINYIIKYTTSQNGNVLINEPEPLNKEKTIGDYITLNKYSSDMTIAKDSENNSHNTYNYKYGLSFWIYLDSSNKSKIDKYISLLNYGNKPQILYNAFKNTLQVTMLDDKDISNVIVELPKIFLQKWNNIIINYNGGTLDIFYNGKLLKSAINIIPLMSYDILTIGQENGINGKICNITYFNDAMNIKQIYYLYNLLKNETPPIMPNTNIITND